MLCKLSKMSFKEISLCSFFVKSFDTLRKLGLHQRLLSCVLNLSFIYMLITYTPLQCKLKQNSVFA